HRLPRSRDGLAASRLFRIRHQGRPCPRAPVRGRGKIPVRRSGAAPRGNQDRDPPASAAIGRPRRPREGWRGGAMNPVAFVRFLNGFAIRDLIKGGAWRPTLVNVASTAVVTALTLTALGLAVGATERQKRELERKGLPPVYCGDPNINDA